MDKQSSDERLLKIIEGSGDSLRGQANMPVAKKFLGHPTAIKFSLATAKNLFTHIKFNLAKINAALIGMGVLLTLIFLITLVTGPVISKSNAAYFTPSDSAAVLKFITAGEAQGLLRKNTGGENLKRNFFMPAGFKSEGISAEESTTVLDELKDFKLVGIIWGANPEVMIENGKDARTYTLKKGESFNDQFKVKDISRNSVILEVNLSSGAKEYELR
jgi:hypothetical protein